VNLPGNGRKCFVCKSRSAKKRMRQVYLIIWECGTGNQVGIGTSAMENL
jgi:hypothetical protein